MTRRRAWQLAAVAALVAIPALAWARPGGGDSYSGGGGHGGGDGGGGGDSGAIGELIFQLLRLCFYYPKVGVPLLLIVVGFVVYGAWVKHKNKDWDSGPPVELARATARIDDLRRVDPDFSLVLFEDFAYRLYATAQGARGRPGGLDELAPYLSDAARAALAARSPGGPAVTAVVVGAMRVFQVEVPTATALADDPAARSQVSVEFEANYAVGDSKRFVVERWVLTRAATARTRPPSPARVFPCPSCGAPWQTAAAAGGQRCASCDQIVDNGRFDWQVASIRVLHERANLPGLTDEVPERGTDLPTYRDDHIDQQWLALTAADPAVADASIIARLHYVYRVVNDAWAAGDLAAARPVLSDGMADYLQYWLDAYKAQGLRNVLEHMRITHQVPAKLRRDRYYDALTIRIWGTGKDYVVRVPSGAHVRGSKHRERAYSEYWTLIRSAARQGPPRADGACGNCGAPLVVTMAGACDHCGVHVTAGEFDWVLSKIEQDDSYRG
ncbi:MAG: TIM44-like domain-containing protein [Kofleriaceae bacterium]